MSDKMNKRELEEDLKMMSSGRQFLEEAEHCEEVDFVQPQVRKMREATQPKIGYISIDDVMSVFDDFMCGEVDEDETHTFLEMLKDKAESEDKE